MSKWSTDETELDLIKALAGGNGLPTSETWFEGEMMSNARKQHLLIARSKEPPVSAKERHLGTKRGKPFGSGGGEDTDDRYKTNMQGFGPGAWLEGEDAKHKAEYKAMARQRLERAEQRGVQVLGGHHYLAGVEHVEASTPHVEERSKRGMDRGEVGAWYTGPPPQDPREKAGQEPRAMPSSVAGRVVLGGEKARATSYTTTPPVQGWRDRTRDPTVYGGGWKANPWREQFYQPEVKPAPHQSHLPQGLEKQGSRYMGHSVIETAPMTQEPAAGQPTAVAKARPGIFQSTVQGRTIYVVEQKYAMADDLRRNIGDVHDAEYKSLYRQRLERAERRGPQCFGGHHHLAGEAHVQDRNPEKVSAEVGSWYKAPTPGEYNKEANYRAFKAGNTTFGGKTQTQNPTKHNPLLAAPARHPAEPPPSDDAVVNKAADALMFWAKESEPSITALLQDVCWNNQGELHGLEYKFKGKESLLRKIRKDIETEAMKALEEGDDTPVDLVGVVWEIGDAVRYTMIVPTETYTPAVQQAMSQMEARGYAPEHLKNYWPGGDGYQGINFNYSVPCAPSPSGRLVFELQFHTPESFAFKMKSHDLYEIVRSARDPDAKRAAWDEQARQAAAVPVPAGVLAIPHPTSKAMPGEVELYAELALKRAMAIEDVVVQHCGKLVGGRPPSWKFRNVEEITEQLKKIVKTLDDGNDDDGPELKAAVNMLPDVLTLNFTFPETGYADSAAAAASRLRGAFAAAASPRNGWADPTCGTLGYRLYLCVAGADDGVAFTDDRRIPFCVALHTPASLAADAALDECWRARETAKHRGVWQQAGSYIAAHRAKVKVPPKAPLLGISLTGTM